MNELQIFSKPSTDELRKMYPHDRKSYLGHFYLLEYGEGLKIGSTNNPAERFAALQRGATKYGNVEIGAFGVSKAHTNYRENEFILHKQFDSFRQHGTELFSVSFAQAQTIITALPIEYRDDSHEFETRVDAFREYAKEFTGLGDAVKMLKTSAPIGTGGLQLFTNSDLGVSVRVIENPDGSISINAEDVAVGLGWTQTKNGILYVKWERLNQHCTALGFSPQVGKDLGFSPLVGKDDYIPEALFYMLAMKANNEAALKFQKWLAFDVVPSIRRSGSYTVKRAETEQRVITADDYLTAARILAGCRNERLPYVLPLIKKAGIELELDGQPVIKPGNAKDPATARLLNTALNDYDVSIRALERLTGIHTAQLYRMRNGTARYNEARAAIIRDVVHALIPELDIDAVTQGA